MTTTARVGVDIVAADRTAAAFASVRKNVTGFAGGLGVLKGAIAGAFAGFAAGGFVKSMIQSFVEVNKHLPAVKQSFTQIDRAWQQFALNVGRGGLNDAIIRFNNSLSNTMVAGRSLAAVLGGALGIAIDAVAFAFNVAGRSIEFVFDNITKLSNFLGNAKAPFDGVLDSLIDIDVGGQKFKVTWEDVMGTLEKSGVDVSAFRNTAKTLPPTFAEVEEATKKAEAQQKKLTDAYRGGIQGLQDYANGLMLQSQTFGMTDAAAAVYTKKFEFLTRMQREGVKLTAAQTAEMNNWLEVIGQSSAKIEQQKSAFESLETMKESVADTLGDIGHIFSSGFLSAFDSIVDRTSSVKDAFKDMAKGILRSLASLAINKDFQMVFGGYSAGSNGSAGSGLGLIGSVIGSIFGGKRAAGGPVKSGKAYLVGEKGPEIVKMGGNGTVIPHGALAAAGGSRGGVAVNVNLNAPGADRTAIAALRADLNKMASTIGNTIKSTVQREYAVNPGFGRR